MGVCLGSLSEHEHQKLGRIRRDMMGASNPSRTDLPTLNRTMKESLSTRMRLTHSPIIDASTMKALTEHNWPGNLRELADVLERGLILSGTDPMSSDHPGLAHTARNEAWNYTTPFPGVCSLQEAMDKFRRAILEQALERTGGTRRAAAELLGVSRFALFRLLKALGIEEEA